MLFARSQLALLVASLVSCACGSASRNGPAFEPLPAPKSHYDSETAQVFVKDARKGVSSQRTFDTPWMTRANFPIKSPTLLTRGEKLTFFCSS